GFAQLHGSNDPGARVTLTEDGRRVVIELVAAAKAIEAHAENNLGFEEAQLLKQALRSIIRETDPGPPPLNSPGYTECLPRRSSPPCARLPPRLPHATPTTSMPAAAFRTRVSRL